MTKPTQISLRARLRTDTRVSHERLDEEVSRFDLTTPGGLCRFLRMQSEALQALAALAVSANTKPVVCDLLERADQDLRRLGSLSLKRLCEIESLHPIAVDYAIAGSRFGSQLLKKRWQTATNQQVRRADAYFSAASYIGMWTSFCNATEAMSSSGPLADQIVQDANWIFHLYLKCARAPQQTNRAIHV